MRVEHFLSAHNTNKFPKNLVLFDTEASIEHLDDDHQRQRLRLGSAVNLRWKDGAWTERWCYFKTIPEFWAFLDSCLSHAHAHLWLMAHNTKYDASLTDLDGYMATRKFNVGTWVISPVFLIKAKTDKFHLTIGDSMNWYSNSLKKLGEMVGIHKAEVPDFEKVSDETLFAYCRQDVQVLKAVVQHHIAFIVDNDLGKVMPTIAGQAFETFKHRWVNESQILVHNRTDILKMERDAYHGGRCEAFFLGQVPGTVYDYDINSMYPYVMRNFRYPVQPSGHEPYDGITLATLESLLKKQYIIAEVAVELYNPCVAVRKEKLIFPVGRVKTILSSPEIEWLLAHPEDGAVLEVGRCMGYKTADIFSGYVDYFYALKKVAQGASRESTKKLLNGLYGKFGQCAHPDFVLDNTQAGRLHKAIMQDQGVYEIRTTDQEGNNIVYYLLGDRVYSQVETPEDRELSLGNDACPVIASAVTAYARVHLWSLMKTAGLANVFYIDTDSLFVNSLGRTRLIEAGVVHESDLGKLKMEKSGQATIYGAKWYQFNDELKIKGVGKKDTLTDRGYRHLNMVTGKKRYADGYDPGVIDVEYVYKRMSGRYDKGVVRPDGTVRPHRLAEF